MKKYIRALNGNIPIILQGNKIIEYDIEINDWASLSYKENQFVYSKIMNLDVFYKHGYGRLYKYKFGKGIIQLEYSTVPCIIFCENKKVMIDKNWSENYSPDFIRFKKMLRENGYSVRKDIIYLYNIDSFLVDPLQPDFNDYSTEYQQEVSREFILSLQPVVIPSVEDNVDIIAEKAYPEIVF